MKKTNAARILDSMSVCYEIRTYEVDESDLSAENVAVKIGLPLSHVFKTLVAVGDKTGVLLAVVPGDAELDLDALARLSGNKKVAMIPQRDLQHTTGYIRGGVSPVGTKKSFPTYLDESALQYKEIAVSAGARGIQLVLSPHDLERAVNARTGKLRQA
ncbi:MAG TPA: Cys-tRNA(Pro) deacylase [Armatimonadota bacterium]|jgi:Cys-tRNA(Pro)/Cys-tRNA(Cys) deacylase